MNKRSSTLSLSPVLPTKQLRANGNQCILCNDFCDEKQKVPNPEHWYQFKENAIKWRGLDKYGTAADTIDWDSGPLGKYWHKSCKAELGGERKLNQAIARSRKVADEIVDEKADEKVAQPSHDDERPATRKSIGVVHDSSLCIWCMSGCNKRKPGKRGELHQVVNQKTWQRITASVPLLKNSTIRTRMEVLVNGTIEPLRAGMKYHSKCYLDYVTKAAQEEAEDKVSNNGTLSLSEVREMFLAEVENRVFVEGEPATLKQLLREYENFLLDYGIMRTSLKTFDIKNMLEEKFGERIGFHERYRKNESTLVFDKNEGGTFLEAALNCWGVTDERLFEIAGQRLRENVISADEPMKWPLSTAELCNYQEPDAVLHSFVKELSAKSTKGELSESLFLTDALHSHITGKRTPLKTKFAVTLHGSVRSKVLSDLAADMGIASTYKDVQYLYDTWALDDLSKNNQCPSELAEDEPGTAILDNDNWITEDITGETTAVNRTNMMFVQPEKWINKDKSDEVVHVQRKDVKDKLKEITASEHAIKNYYCKDRGEPGVRAEVDIAPGSTASMRSRMMAHAIVRNASIDEDEDEDSNYMNPDEQDIPSFTGFMNSIMPFDEKSKAYYFLSLPESPTKAVVYTCLLKAAAASEAKNMPFIQVIGDQPVYAFIVELKNENPEKFKRILPVLGSFHIQMSFMSAIHKRIQGSNIEDLLSEAGLITGGSVHKALKGKNYYQALRLYKLYYEGLSRLLIQHGKDAGIECPLELEHLINTIRDIEDSRENRYIAFETLINSPDFNDYIQKLRKSQDNPNFHMANYILSIMDMIEILFLNIDSLRRKDWAEFKNSLRLMMPWLLMYDNVHYGRYLPIFWIDMATLPEEWDKFMPEIFSQSMTGNPYSAIPPDLWIECTMNRGSKLKAGWNHLLKNERGLLVHIRNMNNVNLVRNSLTNLVSQLKEKVNGHKENTKPRRRLDEKALQDLCGLIEEWNCNPFDPSQQQLRTMMSGEIADDKLVLDFESAHSSGEKLITKNFKERIFSKDLSLYSNMPTQGRSSFANHVKDEKEKAEEAMQTKVAVKMIDMHAKEGSEVFENRITDECLSVFNTNGTIRKCNKAKTKDVMKFVEISPKEYIVIVDAGYLWRLAKPKKDEYMKTDGSKLNWEDYAERIFDTIISRHPNAKSFIIVNDYYGSDVINPKDGERSTRGKKFVGGNSPNVYPASKKELPSFRLLSDFFKSNANKERLQIFLRDEFTKRCIKRNINMTYCTRTLCLDISASPTKFVPLYRNEKIEADNAIFYIYHQLRKSGETGPVVCDAADVDIMITAAYVSTRVPGVLGIKRKKGIFSCHELLPEKVAPIAVRGHVISGMDNISSFFGIGKVTIWNRIIRNAEAQNLLETMTEESIKKFIIKFVYSDKSSETLTDVRWKRWKKMKNKCFKRLGIDEDSNHQRSKRVLFTVSSIEHFDQPNEFGNPLLNGYELNEMMKCVPTKYTKVALPAELLQSNAHAEPVTRPGPVEGDDSNDQESDDEETDHEEENFGDE